MSVSSTSKEQRAITYGFFLILIVVVFTIGRSYLANRSPDPDTTSNQQTQNTPAPTSAKAEVITHDALNQRLNSIDYPGKIFVADLRDSKAYAWSHIIGSVNASSATIAGMLPPNRPDGFMVVLVDDAANLTNTNDLANTMVKDGVSTIVLDGGFDAWTSNLEPTISVGDTSSMVDASKVTIISPEDAKKFLDQNAATTVVIDTRFSTSFTQGHVPHAINIPLEQLETRRNEIPRGKSVLVYNDAPVPGFQSAVRLFDLGALGAKVIEGGWSAWTAKGYPVTR